MLPCYIYQISTYQIIDSFIKLNLLSEYIYSLKYSLSKRERERKKSVKFMIQQLLSHSLIKVSKIKKDEEKKAEEEGRENLKKH